MIFRWSFFVPIHWLHWFGDSTSNDKNDKCHQAFWIWTYMWDNVYHEQKLMIISAIVICFVKHEIKAFISFSINDVLTTMKPSGVNVFKHRSSCTALIEFHDLFLFNRVVTCSLSYLRIVTFKQFLANFRKRLLAYSRICWCSWFVFKIYMRQSLIRLSNKSYTSTFKLNTQNIRIWNILCIERHTGMLQNLFEFFWWQVTFFRKSNKTWVCISQSSTRL